MSVLTPENKMFYKSGIYYGLGGGMRTRNENFAFGTIEFRFAYFPRSDAMANKFKFVIYTNLRFKFNNSYVHAPDIVQLNSDPTDSIYSF